ncbi:MAG: tRNA (adenosine(37)-N6)-threonylcarbamoyltransferase complex dimerization subunit type 1 TsaB [Elusimicrobia bacterium]|nr:tRNA (adenosine(37)-N6)-threonylcarbamoyltransferase complex dimerization subunit type 1 TsaB [Elusimicrobiota bacterium]
MKILAVDTTSKYLKLALCDGARIFERCLRVEPYHDEVFFKVLRQIFEKTAWRIQSLDRIVVAQGPGRFTGIRIGMTFANVLGRFLRKPVVGVSVLEALAFQAGTNRKKSGLICSLVPAIREEVYWQLFRWDIGRKFPLVTLTRPVCARIEAVEQSLKANGKDILYMGLGETREHKLKASSLALLALARPFFNSRLPAPLYIKEVPANYNSQAPCERSYTLRTVHLARRYEKI